MGVKEYKERKELKKFESRGANNGFTISLRQISFGILLFIALVGSIIAHEDRYVNADELLQHAAQNDKAIQELKEAQAKAQQVAIDMQQSILDKLDELHK